MIRTGEKIYGVHFGVPRVSGDDPYRIGNEVLGMQCSPRERG